MALSNAQRQARYRQRHLNDLDGDKAELSLVIDLEARWCLHRIAQHKGRTVTSLIEEWAVAVEDRIVRDMSAEAQRDYYADGDAIGAD